MWLRGREGGLRAFKGRKFNGQINKDERGPTETFSLSFDIR